MDEWLARPALSISVACSGLKEMYNLENVNCFALYMSQ